MKLVFSVLLLLGSWSVLSAQSLVPVTFKVFPPDYELFASGDRMSFVQRSDGLRTYQLPLGSVRVNLVSEGASPLSLSLDVKAGMAPVQAKLEPRFGSLLPAGEAKTGKLPRGLAFSSDGNRLYVAQQGAGSLDVFEVPTLASAGTWTPQQDTGAGFSDVLVKGTQVWAVQRDGRLHVFDDGKFDTDSVVSTSVGGNSGLFAWGTKGVAVANWDNGVITVFDSDTKQVSATARVTGSLRGVAAGPDKAFATLFDLGKLVRIDLSSGRITGIGAAGTAPRPVAVLGNHVFIGDMANARVLVQDATTGQTLATVPVASNPHQMAWSESAGLVAVASRGRNNPTDYQLPGPEFGKVTLLDKEGTVLASVWGRNQPMALAFSANGHYLAFADFLDDNVELYRVRP